MHQKTNHVQAIKTRIKYSEFHDHADTVASHIYHLRTETLVSSRKADRKGTDLDFSSPFCQTVKIGNLCSHLISEAFYKQVFK